MPKKLADVEQEMRAESDAAHKWYRTHSQHLPPAYPVEPRIINTDGGDEPSKRRFVWLFENDDTLADVVYDESQRFVPLQGQDRIIDLRSAMKSARVRHVLEQLPGPRGQLLLDYYVNGIPWQELRYGDESRQAVHQRVQWAKNAFLRALVEHGMDPVSIGEGDL